MTRDELTVLLTQDLSPEELDILTETVSLEQLLDTIEAQLNQGS